METIQELEAKVQELEDTNAKALEANQQVMVHLQTENQAARDTKAKLVAAERTIEEYRWLSRMLAGGEKPFHRLPNLKETQIKAD